MYYIVVKAQWIGELFEVSGPYFSHEEAEEDFDFQLMIWQNNLDENQYLSIVKR